MRRHLPDLFQFSTLRFSSFTMGIRQSINDLYDQYYDIIELSDFSIPTFLALGGVVQLIALASCGPRIGAILPVAWLVFRLAKAVITSRGIGKTSFIVHKKGKFVSKLPDETDGIVVFIIGARLNQYVFISSRLLGF